MFHAIPNAARVLRAVALFTTLTAVLAVGGATEAAPHTESAAPPAPDYAWWTGLSSAEKDAAVVGAVRAIVGASQAGYFQGRQDADAGMVAALSADRQDPGGLLARVNRYPGRPLPAFSHGIAYYREQIDGYYRKHPAARRHVFVSVLLGCLADRAVMTCDQEARLSGP